MEGGGLGDLFGDPEELQRRLAEFAEQMHGQQRLAWADNAIKLAVDMTVAAGGSVNGQGQPEERAEQIPAERNHVIPQAGGLLRQGTAGHVLMRSGQGPVPPPPPPGSPPRPRRRTLRAKTRRRRTCKATRAPAARLPRAGSGGGL